MRPKLEQADRASRSYRFGEWLGRNLVMLVLCLAVAVPTAWWLAQVR